MLRCSQCSAVVSEYSMNEIADRVLNAYSLIGELDPARVKQSREKIIGYIDKLASAGQNDPHQLTVYALAYLKELHEGPDPRFTGC
jgi:uroporphyrinogen-III decarboxylase